MDRNSVGALRVAHLGKILSNIAILGVVLCTAAIAYFLLIAIYYIILITILFGTLFLILVEYPEFMNLFTNTETINDAMVKFSATYVPIIAPITLVVSAVAIAALLISKQKNITTRLVFSIICLLASLIFTVMFTFMGGIEA